MMSKKIELLEFLGLHFKDRRFNVEKFTDGVVVIHYDAYMGEGEVTQLQELLDKLKIDYRLVRMVF